MVTRSSSGTEQRPHPPWKRPWDGHSRTGVITNIAEASSYVRDSGAIGQFLEILFKIEILPWIATFLIIGGVISLWPLIWFMIGPLFSAGACLVVGGLSGSCDGSIIGFITFAIIMVGAFGIMSGAFKGPSMPSGKGGFDLVSILLAPFSMVFRFIVKSISRAPFVIKNAIKMPIEVYLIRPLRSNYQDKQIKIYEYTLSRTSNEKLGEGEKAVCKVRMRGEHSGVIPQLNDEVTFVGRENPKTKVFEASYGKKENDERIVMRIPKWAR